MCLSVELWQDSQRRVGTKTKLMFELTMLAVKHTFKKPLKWRATKSYHVDPSQPTVHLCIILTKVADIIGATPPHNRNSCMCAHMPHRQLPWQLLLGDVAEGGERNGGNAVKSRIEEAAVLVFVLLLHFLIIQDNITQGNQEWSFLNL